MAVKVLRPGIERAFRKDIDAFYLIARTIEIVAPQTRRLRPMDVITHFEGVVMGELDLRLESSAAAEFAANTEKDDGFRVPRPVWFLSGKTVMTLGWAEGFGMNDNAAIDAAGLDRKKLASRVLVLARARGGMISALEIALYEGLDLDEAAEVGARLTGLLEGQITVVVGEPHLHSIPPP